MLWASAPASDSGPDLAIALPVQARAALNDLVSSLRSAGAGHQRHRVSREELLTRHVLSTVGEVLQERVGTRRCSEQRGSRSRTVWGSCAPVEARIRRRVAMRSASCCSSFLGLCSTLHARRLTLGLTG